MAGVKRGDGEGEAEKQVKGKRFTTFSPQTPSLFSLLPSPLPLSTLLLLGSLYGELKNEVRFQSYLDLIKKVKTRVALATY